MNRSRRNPVLAYAETVGRPVGVTNQDGLLKMGFDQGRSMPSSFFHFNPIKYFI